jgi:galactose mutarotase-like enzyme
VAAIEVITSSVQGVAALTLANGLVSVTLIPALGGKISSIRDLRTGRDWLWTSDQLPYRRLPYGASYVREADTGGWDECFPTVAACVYPLEPWRGAALPDHGEIWPLDWTASIEGDPAARITVRTEARGTALPYAFRRAIALAADTATLRVDYQVESLADAAIGFIWSAHPLFAVEPGMRVLLPDDTRLHTWLVVPPNLIPDAGPHPWPLHARFDGRDVDLSVVPDATAGIACKLWSAPLARGHATLQASDGAFHFAFDPALVPQIGLWINAGGWSGTGGEPSYNVALEPCIGAQDSLQEAVERHGQYALLPAHGLRTWWLEVTLEARENMRG